MKVGLYFGTFNPIHIGHLIIANYLAEYSDLDQIWFVITPHSPFKKKRSLLDNHHRHQMVIRTIEDYSKLKANTIEFKLPQPNYTIHTLVHLQEKYPTCHFSLIMGEDNLKGFHKWKNYEEILKNHTIYVYPRMSKGQIEAPFKNHDHINLIDAPIIELSSTFIRKAIKEGKNIKPMLPEKAWIYLDEMNFYK